MSEVVTLQVLGTLTGEMQKEGGWSEFHVAVEGNQYPLRLSTKLDDIKEQARAAFGMGETLWTFGQSDGKENPNRPGTFYKNRRLKKAEVGGTPDPALQQPGTLERLPGLPSPPVTDDRAESIERQVILKAFAPLLQAGNDFELEQWWKLVERADAWFATPRAGAAKGAEVPPPPPPAAADDDDGIPF